MKYLLPLLLLPLLPTAEPVVDPRTQVVLRRDCAIEAGHQEVTLFANGTLRLREGERRREEMLLAELPPDELEAVENRLLEIDLSETDPGRPGVEGDLIESCRLELELAGRPEREFYFGRFDSLALALSHLNGIADELVETARDRAPSAGLPRDYRPRPGDVLERSDGSRFRVIAFTSDRRGVELVGLDTPLSLYVAREDLRGAFVEVVERQAPLVPGSGRDR